MAKKSVKGYALEYFVRSLLFHNSFTQVIPDDNYIVYSSGSGLMIQGLGQSHNADVLVNPPIQIPFYYPSRLLIECKCYTQPLGLPFARNVLGLREDINGFDVIDKNILRSRMNTRRVSPSLLDFNRYQYQVALASLSGFKITTQEFAHIHRIPLISFSSSIFEEIRNAIYSFDELDSNQEDTQKLIEFLQTQTADNSLDDLPEISELHRYISIVNNFVQRSKIGMLDDGTLLFLIKPLEKIQEFNRYIDGVTLHWSQHNNYWLLDDNGDQYYFELPEKLFRIWACSGNNRYEDAINIKANCFKNIILFEQGNYGAEIKTLHVSKEFITDALQTLDE